MYSKLNSKLRFFFLYYQRTWGSRTFCPVDSGAPLILGYELKGILANLDEGSECTNPGVFAYVEHPDNFDFINDWMVDYPNYEQPIFD